MYLALRMYVQRSVILGQCFIVGSGSEQAAHCCSYRRYSTQVFSLLDSECMSLPADFCLDPSCIMSKSGTSITVLIACHVAVCSPAAMECSIAAHSKLRPSADLWLCCLGVHSLVCVESLFGESCDSLQVATCTCKQPS